MKNFVQMMPQKMFLREGMNDFVAKPIELKMLVAKVRQWLPIEKIQRVYEEPGQKKPVEEEKTTLVVGDLDTQAAIKLLGSEKLFWKVLKDYYRVIERKADTIKNMEEAKDWAGYTIEVHALKSVSKQIGAMELSRRAQELEKAGNARNIAFILKHTDEMLERYRAYLPVLEPFFKEEQNDNAEKEIASEDVLQGLFADMRDAVENLDMDRMEEVIQKMAFYRYEEAQMELFEQLKTAVEDVDVDTCEKIVTTWESSL